MRPTSLGNWLVAQEEALLNRINQVKTHLFTIHMIWEKLDVIYLKIPDLFTMRIQFCEEKVVSCLDKEEEWEESVNEYNGKFSRCQPVFHECLKDHLLVAGDRP